MFHIGHLNILKRAKQQCEYLIVGVTTDELCFKRKGKYPIIKQEERMQIVEAIKYVDKVVLQDSMDKIKNVIKNNVDVVFVGSDWKGTSQWNEYEIQFKKVNCDVIYLPHTDGISSTLLREKIKKTEVKNG
jgi:glycerol-3-phosphate cytidylyltransferase